MAASIGNLNSRVPQRPPILGDLAILIGLALVLVILHTLTNGQYGFHRDELDTLDNAGRPAWGYVAYPPLTPFMGRLALTLFGPSLPLVRLPAALAMGAVLVLTGLMARDLGGRRPAQIVAAVAAAISPVALIGGVMLHPRALPTVRSPCSCCLAAPLRSPSRSRLRPSTRLSFRRRMPRATTFAR